jgi:hypothetical protein
VINFNKGETPFELGDTPIAPSYMFDVYEGFERGFPFIKDNKNFIKIKRLSFN